MTDWNPNYDPLPVGNTVYDAFSLGRQILKSIDKNENLGHEVVKLAAKFEESLSIFNLSLKEAREHLILSDMDEDSRSTLQQLIGEGNGFIEYIQCLLSAFRELCTKDKKDPEHGFEDFFIEGFLGVRDACQWDAIQSLTPCLEYWEQRYEDWMRR